MDTLSFKDFRLVSCQAVFFTPDEEVSSTKLIKDLVPRWLDALDAEPIIVPSGRGLPPEAPKLILGSKSGEWRCQIASVRIDFFWQKPKPDVAEIGLPDFFAKTTTLFNEYREFLGARVRVGRMAVVLNRYVEHALPGIWLAEHFCQERWRKTSLNRPENFELHAHKTFLLAGRFHVNSWVRSKTGQELLGEQSKRIILVEQDINTLSEEADKVDFTKDDIEEFFSAVTTELGEILQLYYPEEG